MFKWEGELWKRMGKERREKKKEQKEKKTSVNRGERRVEGSGGE